MTDFTKDPPKPSAGRLREKVIGALYTYAVDGKAEIATLQLMVKARDAGLAIAEADRLQQQAEIARLTALIPVAQPPPPPPPVVTHTDEFFDALGHVWWRENGVAFRDGVATESAEVVKLAPVLGVARQTNKQGNSWDWSEAVKQWVRVAVAEPVPPVLSDGTANPFSPDILHAAHFMTCFVIDKIGSGQARSYVQTMFRFAKANSQNGSFAFQDNPVGAQFDPGQGAIYEEALQLVLDVALEEKFPIIPQMQPQNATADALVYWWQKFADHPAILRVAGVPVFAFWNWKPNTDAVVRAARAKWGRRVILITCGDWWELMGTDKNGNSVRPGGLPPLHDDANRWDKLDVLIAEHPEADGWLNFAAGVLANGAAAAVPKIVEQNANLVRFCAAAGKIAMPGWAARYHDHIIDDAGLRAQWTGIRATGAKWATLSTANDETEKSGINHSEDQHFHDVIHAEVDAFLNR